MHSVRECSRPPAEATCTSARAPHEPSSRAGTPCRAGRTLPKDYEVLPALAPRLSNAVEHLSMTTIKTDPRRGVVDVQELHLRVEGLLG